jgi:hypothetical protein
MAPYPVSDAEGWLQYFHPSRLAYHDATLGLGSNSRFVIQERFGAIVSAWPENATSYPLRVLGTRVEGRLAIGRYLRRALGELPYGPARPLRHVLGSARGGGYEWQTNSEPVRNGITALELDGDSTITRLTAVWDASRMSDAAMRCLTTLSIED